MCRFCGWISAVCWGWVPECQLMMPKGAGTDVAIESAGIVLASDDPRGVVGVRRLSQAGYRKMLQNLGWAAGYNVIAIPLAAGALARRPS